MLDDNILYVMYKRCFNMKEYSFKEMVEDIKKDIIDNKTKKYILDLRDNRGGNSSIINPFIDLVSKHNLKGVLLINNGVYSSGRFAVRDFKKRFATPLIGQSTGGKAKAYGEVEKIEIDGKTFNCSTKLWDLSADVNTTGVIHPDVEVQVLIEDLENNYDRVLDETLKILKKED